MSLEAITQKIISDAEKQAESIHRETEREIRQIDNRLQAERQALEEKYREQTEAKLSQNRSRVLTGATAEIKKQLEVEKREAVNRVFRQAVAELNDLDQDQYIKLLKHLLADLKPEEVREATVRFPADRKNETKQAADDLGLFFERLETDHGIKGGVVISGQDFTYDLRFTTLIDNLQEQTEVEAAGILFNSRSDT